MFHTLGSLVKMQVNSALDNVIVEYILYIMQYRRFIIFRLFEKDFGILYSNYKLIGFITDVLR